MTSAPAGSQRKSGKGFPHLLWQTLVRYSDIDGPQRAASFAYYAFFAMFPLLLLMVSIGAFVFNPAKVNIWVVDALSALGVPVEHSKHDFVTQTIRGIIKSRSGAGFFAVTGLIWGSFRFFQSLVRAVNRAWGTHEYKWWRLPIQNLLMVAILAVALAAGLVGPSALAWAQRVVVNLKTPFNAGLIALFDLVRLLLPSAILFCGLSMFYRLAPRRPTLFREVWIGALAVTLLLRVLQILLVLYARNVAHFNAIYGAFGAVIAILIWVYLSGSVIILGGCFCAISAEAEGHGALPDPAETGIFGHSVR